MILDVLVAVKTKGENEVFSYLIPRKLRDDIVVGSIVEMPFGRRNERGIIIRIKNKESGISERKYQLKQINSISKFEIPASYFGIIDWVSGHYFCTRGEALELFLPPKITRMRDKSEARISKSETNSKFKKLNNNQNKIFGALKKELTGKDKKPALIYGVTGSGKTEIYLHLAKETLKLGKQVIILVPEIMLTPQTIERFEEVFGDKICLMHSKLNKSQRMKCYEDFSTGTKPIIVGPRSALLVPSENIGLIVVDEEQEDSYKQEQNPRYHAVDLAEKIAESNNSLLVLGTATPRIETYYKTKTGSYNLFEIKNRYNKLMLPPAEIIDLREEIKKDNRSLISERLKEEIARTLKDNKQVLLFLNRRGSSTFISCRECGYVMKCPNCDIPLIHHTSSYNLVRCHHCDYKSNLISVCPECRSINIKFFGAGVEKVEHQIHELFPKARVVRVDAGTITSKFDYQKLYRDIKDKKIDIILGTQMLAKGHDFPDIDLVGIISADTGLHLPYFRASEKTFRIITQVSGRSGRIHNVGKTIIQTYWPKSRAILAATRHDFEYFYKEEIEHRKESSYPPFSNLIRVVSEDKNIEKARRGIEATVNDLRSTNIEFIGPGLCFFQRIRDRWRYHIIIKLATSNLRLATRAQKDQFSTEHRASLRSIYLNHQDLTWDVDPVDLL
jgi:primosomal protein N' (replication factor Y)